MLLVHRDQRPGSVTKEEPPERICDGQQEQLGYLV
jgi:hypothetical protein